MFANYRKNIANAHPAILELVLLLNIVGIDVAEIATRNDKCASFRDIQRYIVTSR